MKLHRLTFSHSASANLPEDEQLFFFRLALLRNDLRHIESLYRIAKHNIKSTNGVERKVVLHQFLFAVRLLYGTLNEAWNIIKIGWDGTRLGKTFAHRLPSDAKESLQFLRRYFSGDNLVRTIRDQFAFHYYAKNLKHVLMMIEATEDHEFVTGKLGGNVFYGFAETVRNQAMTCATGEVDDVSKVRRFYKEPFRVHRHLVKFSDAVLRETARDFGIQREVIETTAVIDPADVPSLIFMDENKLSSA
ncbi:MAG TPA: hypothetical protein VGM65_07745 [Candidatus Udaeobacter sp.]|jgi:hypothetical protein